MNDVLNVFYRATGAKAGEDGSDFGTVLISVVAEVDAHWVFLKQQGFKACVGVSETLLERVAFALDILACERYRGRDFDDVFEAAV